MENDNIIEISSRYTLSDPLTELAREGARKIIAAAIEAEVEEHLEQFSHRRTAEGHAGVVRNGYQPERSVQTGVGPVSVRIPKVRSKDGEPVTFRSALVPPYVRKTRTLDAAIPWLYLKGVSSGEMGDALQVLVGPEARGLSASTVSRLKAEWAAEYDSWRKERIDDDEWVYIWGRWHLQRPPGRGKQALRPRDHGRQYLGTEEIPGH